MAKKIIDFKRVDITDDEYSLYLSICESYNTETNQGKDLFINHFEVNEHGIITMVRPMKGRFSSLEVYTFLLSLMTNQHLRVMHKQVETLMKESAQKIFEVMDENKKLKEENNQLKERISSTTGT